VNNSPKKTTMGKVLGKPHDVLPQPVTLPHKPHPPNSAAILDTQQPTPSHPGILSTEAEPQSMSSIPNPPTEVMSIDLKSLNEGPLNQLIRDEETYTAGLASSDDSNSMSSLSDQFSPSEKQPVVVMTTTGSMEGGKMDGEARKQWAEEEVKVRKERVGEEKRR
jgi:hypothetical protein